MIEHQVPIMRHLSVLIPVAIFNLLDAEFLLLLLLFIMSCILCGVCRSSVHVQLPQQHLGGRPRNPEVFIFSLLRFLLANYSPYMFT